jgi:molecular chaperone Hsp33
MHRARPHAPKMNDIEIPGVDQVRRFIVENRPVRGHWVRLEGAWREVRAHREYPETVRELLGQVVAASVLLAATLKFRGTLTLQLQGSGAVSLLVAQCTHDFRLRAVAQFDEARVGEITRPCRASPVRAASIARTARSPSDQGSASRPLPCTACGAPLRALSGIASLPRDVQPFGQLVGTDGRIAVTVEAEERSLRYQGVVPLTGASLAESLEAYFASSEQLPTRVLLAADAERGAGVLVQKVPGRAADDESDLQEIWEDTQRGIESLSSTELLECPVEELLNRGFAAHDLRLFRGSPVQFECRCSQGRVNSLLRALGPEEVRDVLREQGAVTVTCEFCHRPYRFDATAVAALFEESGARAPDDDSPTVH